MARLPVLRWYPDALLRVLLDVTLVPVAFVSVFVVMVLSDPSTQWASGPLSGHGLNSDLAVLVAAVGLGWILLALGWRGAGPVFRGALIAWHFTLASLSITTTARAKEFVLRGDAMDLSLSLELIAPAVTVVTLVGTVTWCVRDVRRGRHTRQVSPWHRRNRVAACCALVTLFISWCAFTFDADQPGVLVCLSMTLAMRESLRPLNPAAELHRALVDEGSASA